MRIDKLKSTFAGKYNNKDFGHKMDPAGSAPGAVHNIIHNSIHRFIGFYAQALMGTTNICLFIELIFYRGNTKSPS